MDGTYDNIVSALSCVLEPIPLNQLGVPDYCRHILSVLASIKGMIEDLENYYKRLQRSYEPDMDEEF